MRLLVGLHMEPNKTSFRTEEHLSSGQVTLTDNSGRLNER